NMETVTLDLIYSELKSLEKKINIVEHALIPSRKLSQNELSEHKKDLSEALLGKRATFRDI
ncbi:MAG: hypothetical protein V1822_04005, partial [Candidatus Micrarchaeota archaeon]